MAGQEAAAGLCSGILNSCCRKVLSPTPAAVGCGRVPVPSKWSLCCADALVQPERLFNLSLGPVVSPVADQEPRAEQSLIIEGGSCNWCGLELAGRRRRKGRGMWCYTSCMGWMSVKSSCC